MRELLMEVPAILALRQREVKQNAASGDAAFEKNPIGAAC
jgi:hypothetical protein